MFKCIADKAHVLCQQRLREPVVSIEGLQSSEKLATGDESEVFVGLQHVEGPCVVMSEEAGLAHLLLTFHYLFAVCIEAVDLLDEDVRPAQHVLMCVSSGVRSHAFKYGGTASFP